MKRFLSLLLALLALLLQGCGQKADEGITESKEEQAAIAETEENEISMGFEVFFIDVGQADAALVVCDGETMLIDGGNVEDSDLIFSFLRDNQIEKLNYVICTHAHEDHVGGLAGALNYAQTKNALCSVQEYDTKAFENFRKYLTLQNLEIQIPKAGDVLFLGSAKVTVLGPLAPSNNTNDCSIVMRIEYGETSFMFTGDAEREEEDSIMESGALLKSTVLKVGHHGSETSTSYHWLYEIEPEYAVISVGTGNSYGHPSEAVLSRLDDAGVTVFRTDLMGTIVCRSDGRTVEFLPYEKPDDVVSSALSANVLPGFKPLLQMK